MEHTVAKPKKLKDTLPKDKYTADVLRKRYELYKQMVVATQKINEETGLDIRNVNPPEDITENIVKFILRVHCSDASCVWAREVKKSGDLWSSKEGIQEVKSFTSNGPSSFGPKKKFDVIYFLDMREWLQDTLVLWRVNLSNVSADWKAIKMNQTKNETHEDQTNDGRRPHISWERLYPQIATHCKKVYEGTFEGIFTAPAEAPVVPQSAEPQEQTLHSQPACTDSCQRETARCTSEESLES